MKTEVPSALYFCRISQARYSSHTSHFGASLRTVARKLRRTPGTAHHTAIIASYLPDLLKEEEQLIYMEVEEGARNFCSHLTSPPVIALPDFEKCFEETNRYQ